MSVTAPAGFRAAGVAAGLKSSGAPDVAVVVNDGPRHDAAAVFTANRVAAAPVLWSRQVVADGRLDAIVLNSGGANAATGPPGFANTHHTAQEAARLLGVSTLDVAVASTGLIGVRLPMPVLLGGVARAVGGLSTDGGADAAVAIMTTDTRPKTTVARGAGYRVGGMAKGAGMLAPALATMLVVLTTDAVVEPGVLDSALRAATAVTFDRVDSDGCQSTNDTVVLLASGASGVVVRPDELTGTLTRACADLAAQLVADAEGAHHEVAVRVVGGAVESDALEVARAVARNALVKCAIFGRDPNWGRVLAAVGTTHAAFDPSVLDVTMNGVPVCVDSAPGQPRELVDLSGRSVSIVIDLKAGPAEATILTTDLTYDYVRENAEYPT
ncbi:MAG: bifunctional glutamate N-acetyltransferase/amino-acid acetyltransferase ArgJ [Actinomycetes bacterium]